MKKKIRQQGSDFTFFVVSSCLAIKISSIFNNKNSQQTFSSVIICTLWEIFYWWNPFFPPRTFHYIQSWKSILLHINGAKFWVRWNFWLLWCCKVRSGFLPSTQEGLFRVVPATFPGKHEHLTVWERSSMRFLLQHRCAAMTSHVPPSVDADTHVHQWHIWETPPSTHINFLFDLKQFDTWHISVTRTRDASKSVTRTHSWGQQWEKNKISQKETAHPRPIEVRKVPLNL